jgi:ankyrin repeat protein
MNLLDSTFRKQENEAQEKYPCQVQFCKPTSVINRRDHYGRTPLWCAVAFSNKMAVETLLQLGANPHIADIYG